VIRIKGGKDYLVALESVAMTDIVMNMFIFFFISFSLLYTFNSSRMSKIDVSLPKADSAVKLEGTEKIILSISKDGRYYIGDKLVRRSDLKNIVRSRLKENVDAGVLLNIDNRAKFENVSGALDVINDLGISKVSVAAVKRD
jgi:biopolymer transport protein ExbD